MLCISKTFQLLDDTTKLCSTCLLEIGLPCFILIVHNSRCLIFVSLLVIWVLTMIIFFWWFSEKQEGGVTFNAQILASRRNFDYVFSDSMDQSIFMRTGRQESMYSIKNVPILFCGMCVAARQASMHRDCCSRFSAHAVLVLSAEGVNC